MKLRAGSTVALARPASRETWHFAHRVAIRTDFYYRLLYATQAGPAPMSHEDWENQSALARAFAVEGLVGAHISRGQIEQAYRSGTPLNWKPGHGSKLRQGRLEQTVESLADLTSPDAMPPRGLRLLSSLREEVVLGRGAEAIGRIVRHPGYQAAANIPGHEAALGSFVIDSTNVSQTSDYLKLPKSAAVAAFSWPMLVSAPARLAQQLRDSRAAERGFLRFSPQAKNAPSTVAGLVEVDGAAFTGPYLALRFVPPGAQAAPLPTRLSLAMLGGLEPLVLLPLDGRDAGEAITGFVYELAHGLPIDVAAWKAGRFRTPESHAPPLVLAARRFLARAGLSDVIPALKARLRRLAPDSVLQIAANELLRFNDQAFSSLNLTNPNPGVVLDILNRQDEFSWSHEQDTGEGLLAVARGLDEIEQRPRERTARPVPRPQLGDTVVRPDDHQASKSADAEDTPSPTVNPAAGWDIVTGPGGAIREFRRYIDAPDDNIIAPAPVGSPDTVEPVEPVEPTADSQPPGPPPPRYTDVKLFDGDTQMGTNNPLIAGASYTLDIAIRIERGGLAASRDDQPAVAIEGQTEPATIWVVVTDETDRGEDSEGGAFTFNKRYSSFVLPVEGDSQGSARFTIKPERSAFAAGGRGQIGIRLYHKLNLIDHLELDLSVVNARSKSQPDDSRRAIDVIFKRPDDDGGVETPNPQSKDRALTISITRKQGTDLYRLALVVAKDKSDEPRLFATKILSETVLNDFVARFREILLKTVFGPSLRDVTISINERDDFLKEMSLLGTDIVTKLFDYEAGAGDLFDLGAIVSDALPDASIIQISLSKDAEDFVFPWQILTLRPYTEPDRAPEADNLWGYRFVIEVKRPRDGADDRPDVTSRHGPVRLRYARWNFPNEPQHFAFLRDAMQKACAPVVLDGAVIEQRSLFLKTLSNGGGDFIYVFAHGHAAAPSTPAGIGFNNRVRVQIDTIANQIRSNPTLFPPGQGQGWIDTYNLILKAASNTALSSLTLTNSEVLLTSVVAARDEQNMPIRLRDAPIVFLNTCESAQLWNAVEGSFVGFFIKRGARAVLGTESTIPIVVAEEFGRSVLSELFAGKPLGEAVKAARCDLLTNNKNPLGLCYSIYGAADAGLFPPPSPSSLPANPLGEKQ